MSQPLMAPEGWEAYLDLQFTAREGETVLSARRHDGPLRVQRPFYPEGKKVCHVYLLHPPGGLVSGDSVTVDVRVGSGAWVLLTTPGAGKFYRSAGVTGSRQNQHLQLADGARLEWFPQESIFFDGARTDVVTRVDLHGSAGFIGAEVSCLGRPASAEYLQTCGIRQKFEVWREDQPVWIERSGYSSGSRIFSAGWGMQRYSVVGSLFCTCHDESLIQQIRQCVQVSPDAIFSVSQLYGGLVCRYLGHHAEEAHSALRAAWALIRPAVMGIPAVPPRIWNT